MKAAPRYALMVYVIVADTLLFTPDIAAAVEDDDSRHAYVAVTMRLPAYVCRFTLMIFCLR